MSYEFASKQGTFLCGNKGSSSLLIFLRVLSSHSTVLSFCHHLSNEFSYFSIKLLHRHIVSPFGMSTLLYATMDMLCDADCIHLIPWSHDSYTDFSAGEYANHVIIFHVQIPCCSSENQAEDEFIHKSLTLSTSGIILHWT